MRRRRQEGNTPLVQPAKQFSSIATGIHCRKGYRSLARFHRRPATLSPTQPKMNYMRLAALLLCASVSPLAHGQWDARYQIRLSIDGVAVLGVQELETQAQTEAKPGAVYDRNPPKQVIQGRSFQAVVKITDPSGMVVDYTGSPRVQYETFGCATASNLGVITMTPMTGTPCAGSPEYPLVMILLLDASGSAIAANSYLFHVVRTLTLPPPSR